MRGPGRYGTVTMSRCHNDQGHAFVPLCQQLRSAASGQRVEGPSMAQLLYNHSKGLLPDLSGRGAGSGISWKDGVLAPAPDQQIKVKVALSETEVVSTTGF